MERPNDSELKVLQVLWEKGTTPAKDIADALTKAYGYSKNTSYTLINRLIAKGAVEREEPFVCTALITREQVQLSEAQGLLEKLFDGSASMLFAALTGSNKLPESEREQLQNLIQKMDGGERN